MSKLYRCVKEFSVDKYDEHCSWTEEQMLVKEGSIWELDTHPGYYTGGEVTLIGEGLSWLEIDKKSFDDYFEEALGDG